ncbi:MAG: carbon monoxide dehydrogenase subunit G [Nocardioidaceae bacterium]
MKVSGDATLHAPRDKVWEALNDPAVLVQTIPGCQRMETIGVDSYQMTLAAGVASIKGIYQGEVRLTDQAEPDSFTLKAAGAGAPGTVSADVKVTLAAGPEDTTVLTYDADAIVGGMIGGVGQRMLAGVAKKTAGEFFGNVDAVLTGAQVAPKEPAMAGAGADQAGDSAAGQGVFVAPGASMGRGVRSDFSAGVLAGAIAALAGAVIGGWLSSRRRG